jgi:hypothetical protein
MIAVATRGWSNLIGPSHRGARGREGQFTIQREGIENHF